MKIKKINKKNNKIFELYLIKNKIYKQPIKKKEEIENLFESNFSQTILNFKKILNIIYQYNKKNKQILFLGVPENNFLKNTNLTSTKHIIISDLFDIKNLQNNDIKKNKLFEIKSIKPNLIVIFDHNPKKYKSIVEENLKKKIPLIVFTPNKFAYSFKYCYYILTSKHLIKTKNNIFFNIIYNMLKLK